jgi:hypothetical protein
MTPKNATYVVTEACWLRQVTRRCAPTFLLQKAPARLRVK